MLPRQHFRRLHVLWHVVAVATLFASVFASAERATNPVIDNITVLQQVRTHLGQRRIRIVAFGASHIASDQYTGVLRQLLQHAFGDGGIGYVLPARPFPLYEQLTLHIPTAFGVTGLTTRASESHPRLGRAGVAIEVRAGGRFELRLPDSHTAVPVEVTFQRLPGAGQLTLTRGSTTATYNATSGAFSEQRETLRGHGTLLRFEVTGAPVRLLGVSAELPGNGVVLESFGVPGARARDALRWDQACWTQELAHRAPDLLLFGYGTNESGDHTPIARHGESLRAVIQRAVSATHAACMVVGPSDRPQLRANVWIERPRGAELDAEYQRVALAEHCAYVSLIRFQGGALSMPRWVQQGLALADHVHFTDAGYRRLAQALFNDLDPRGRP